MKKAEFYSLINDCGTIKAAPQIGYTDGTFNYYRSPYRGRKWFAIVPSFGVAACNANTLKACAAIAHSEPMREKIEHAKGNGCGERWEKQFTEHVQAAEEAAVPNFLKKKEG